MEAYFSALSSEARKKADAAKTEDEKKKYEDQIKWDDNMRDGLYALISDVLFVRDHKDENKFHPRISVQFDFIFESLYDSDKAIFNRLYNDYYYRRNNQVLVPRGHEEAAASGQRHTHAGMCRRPGNGARLRLMGHERAEDTVSGDTEHAERPARPLRTSVA